MSSSQTHRGGTPVAHLAQLDALEAACVLYLRLWSDGRQAQVISDLARGLGPVKARRAVDAFAQVCALCADYGRRPLMRHAVTCACIGADERCFAAFIATAAEGEPEDALMFATLLVRPDVAPLIASCAAEFGRALMRMNLVAPRDGARPDAPRPKFH
jgi:hypothetical protein